MRLGIIGSLGSGKSTIINLLQRLYVDKDKKLKSFEIHELKRRLKERIDLLNEEIKQIKEAMEELTKKRLNQYI